jgi:hypothetical protein
MRYGTMVMIGYAGICYYSGRNVCLSRWYKTTTTQGQNTQHTARYLTKYFITTAQIRSGLLGNNRIWWANTSGENYVKQQGVKWKSPSTRCAQNLYGRGKNKLKIGKNFLVIRGVGWDWMHLAFRPLVGLQHPPPDDRRVWSILWNRNWQGKP